MKRPITMKSTIDFIDNSAATEQFICIHINAPTILPSWRDSMLAHDWITPDGRLKPAKALSPDALAQRREVEEALNKGLPIMKPILGIGIMDNVEIGSGRATLTTLMTQGVTIIPVHIHKSNEKEFAPYMA